MKRVAKHTTMLGILLYVIPIISGILIFFLIQAQAHIIRPEEIGESVRGPWWFVNHRVYQGLSTHIGWYAQLTAVYTLFGFNLTTARYYRLVLSLVSLLALVVLVKRHMGVTIGTLIVVTSLAFSPTYLAFNAMAAQIGVDLAFIPVALFLLDALHRMKNKMSLRIVIFHGVFWAFVMIAWMSYPTIIVYLPALVMLYGRFVLTGISRNRLVQGGVSIAGFLLPFIAGLVWIDNRAVMLIDPIDQTGIFRGAGRLDIGGNALVRIGQTIQALAGRVPSYYYEVQWPDFSFGIWGVAFVALIMLVALVICVKRLRFVSMTVLLTSGFSVALLAFSSDTSGISQAGVRRATPLLICFTAMLSLGLLWARDSHTRLVRWGLVALLALVPVHHLLVYVPNLTSGESSIYADNKWFFGDTAPQESLQVFLVQLKQQDAQLTCRVPQIASTQDCSYNRIYAVAASVCYFNRIPCKKLWGLDPFTGTYEEMNIDLWERRWAWEKYDAILTAVRLQYGLP